MPAAVEAEAAATTLEPVAQGEPAETMAEAAEGEGRLKTVTVPAMAGLARQALL
jgi:hypothetical protein